MKCQPVTVTTPATTWDILVVDADPAVADLVRSAGSAGCVRIAASVDQAKSEMRHKAADLLLVNLQINDSAGVALIGSLRKNYPNSEIIALSRVKRTELCLDAWRAGAADLLVAPIQAVDLQRSITTLLARKAGALQLTRRNRQLRQVCKQLNKARHEIRQQVDLLCNDLVRAYQEMAQQLNTTQLTVDYCQITGNEIEVEGLLRKTMEWVLAKIGPINAAVYLADADGQFALGAYLNLDTEADSALIAAVGETIVKHSAKTGKTLAVDSDRQLGELFGEAADTLKARSWLSTGCYSTSAKRECLAALVIFRKQGDALEPSRSMIEAVAPILGEKIEQALELYHRMHPREEDESEFDSGSDLEDGI